MSQFLAPIHTWLFNKIVVLESIEKGIAASFTDEEVLKYHTALKESIGDYIPDAPLENLIDQSNIHGWLQDRITKAETRQAALVSKVMTNEGASEVIKSVYNTAGVEAAKALASKVKEPSALFQGVNDVLLEGMPCDRVNAVVEQTEDTFVWKTVQCVHKNNWESNGVDVKEFYGYRAALINGYVTTASDDFEYAYTNDGEQVHKITRKA